MDKETFESRIAKLERIFLLQQALIDKLHVAVKGHQMCIQAFAKILNIELEQQPAPPSPPTN